MWGFQGPAEAELRVPCRGLGMGTQESQGNAEVKTSLSYTVRCLKRDWLRWLSLWPSSVAAQGKGEATGAVSPLPSTGTHLQTLKRQAESSLYSCGPPGPLLYPP